MATAALPILGQTKFVCFLTTGNVVVVVVVVPVEVVVVVVGVVVVVVDPVGIVVVVVGKAFAGTVVSSGLTTSPATTSAGNDAHHFQFDEVGFTDSIYRVPLAEWSRQVRRHTSFEPPCD